jgi:hypothetical protein
MKTNRAFILVAMFAACKVMAQSETQQSMPSSTSIIRNVAQMKSGPLAASTSTGWQDNQEYLEGLNPLIGTTPNISNVQTPLFHFGAKSNPVSTSGKNREYVQGLHPQAWTTIVGWHPGRSAFPSEDNAGSFSTEMPLLQIGQ